MFNSFATPWTVPSQPPLPMIFPRQEYWSGLPFPSPGNFPNSGTEPTSPTLAGEFFTTEPPGSYNLLIKSVLQWTTFWACDLQNCFPHGRASCPSLPLPWPFALFPGHSVPNLFPQRPQACQLCLLCELF